MRAELDGGALPTCTALHRALAEALGFPPWYGGNLDALYDCLTDLPPGTELVIKRMDALTERLGAVYVGRLCRVLDAAAAEGRFRWESGK